MEIELLDKIREMVHSSDSELKKLALTWFWNGDPSYSDYVHITEPVPLMHNRYEEHEFIEMKPKMAKFYNTKSE